MRERDMEKDWEMCQKATTLTAWSSDPVEMYKFAYAAREALPYWIRRAQELERAWKDSEHDCRLYMGDFEKLKHEWDEARAENTRLKSEITRLHADACKPGNCPHCIPAKCDAVQAARREGDAEVERLREQLAASHAKPDEMCCVTPEEEAKLDKLSAIAARALMERTKLSMEVDRLQAALAAAEQREAEVGGSAGRPLALYYDSQHRGA